MSRYANLCLVSLILMSGLFYIHLSSKTISANEENTKGALPMSASQDRIVNCLSNTSGLQTHSSELWDHQKLPAYLQDVDQENPKLIHYIHDHLLQDPDKKGPNFNTSLDFDYSQTRQSIVVDKYLNNKTGGFYIECGAFMGEQLSNSLYFERYRGWEGLLIEANPENFYEITKKHRRAYALNACLSTTVRSNEKNFTCHLAGGRLTDERTLARFLGANKPMSPQAKSIREIQCLPLYSVLAALGNKHIDFFSLDIEGAEVAVLKTIPFDKVDIDVFLIETQKDVDRIVAIKDLLGPHGYHVVKTLAIDILMSKI